MQETERGEKKEKEGKRGEREKREEGKRSEGKWESATQQAGWLTGNPST